MSSDEIDNLFLSIMALYAKRRKLRQKRRWHARPINANRTHAGYHQKTFLRIKDRDESEFFAHTRMSLPVYDTFLKLMAPSLTEFKQQIGVEERLSITLQYLAHGIPFKKIAWSHKIGKSTVRMIVLETCEAIWQTLSPIYLSEPTEQQYKDITTDFSQMWIMPNCFFSIVLLAACDAKYKFTAVSVGAYGSQSDGGIFHATKFGEDLLENRLPLPPDTPLPLSSQPFPHFFVGDCAFPLKNNLMKPYPGRNTTREQRIFNYRLSRARRVIENAFGILTARWRVLKTTMEFYPENAEKIVLACLVLHNFIMFHDSSRWYCPENYTDGEGASAEWRNELRTCGGPLRTVHSFRRRGRNSAYEYREYLTNYFMTDGTVAFQNHIE
ncbi:uncharacterized protein [Eurosta solidaginis]|uniref:uncharacterized protein isoform X1 n=2 Tax=Eurosta solidaginis TaxID=178769 RepID=UPI0035309579